MLCFNLAETTKSFQYVNSINGKACLEASWMKLTQRVLRSVQNKTEYLPSENNFQCKNEMYVNQATFTD